MDTRESRTPRENGAALRGAAALTAVPFLLGGLLGAFSCGSAAAGGAEELASYIGAYVQAALTGEAAAPGFLFLLWEDLKYPAAALVLGLTALGVVGIPVLFFLRVSYVVPLVLGLSLGLSSIIPMSVGIFIYYLIVYVNQNAGVLAGTDTVDIVQKYTQILNSLFTNSTMILMVVAFAAALLVVFLVRNLSLDYAWTIAIGAGTAVLLAVIFIGNSTAGMNLSIVSLALEMLFSVILAFVYQFFAFAVDYSRTEFLQFEDDDYYYYVKAVPKIAVSAPDVKVQRINRREDS